jgi:hypothetical protein
MLLSTGSCPWCWLENAGNGHNRRATSQEPLLRENASTTHQRSTCKPSNSKATAGDLYSESSRYLNFMGLDVNTYNKRALDGSIYSTVQYSPTWGNGKPTLGCHKGLNTSTYTGRSVQSHTTTLYHSHTPAPANCLFMLLAYRYYFLL